MKLETDDSHSVSISKDRGISIEHMKCISSQQNELNSKSNEAMRYITVAESQSPHFLTELPVNEAKFHSLSPIPRKNDNSLLPMVKASEFHSMKTLVLDLDETLIHSSFNPFSIEADISFKVDTGKQLRSVYVLMRPYLEEFLARVAACYEEIVVFTASLGRYANPIIDVIDKHKVIRHRLFREQCTWINRTFVKELKRMNRCLRNVVLLDNNPQSFCLDKMNGIPIKSFYCDKNDKELIQMAYVLEKLAKVSDVRVVINEIVYLNQVDYDKAFELLKHKGIAQHEEESSEVNSLGKVQTTAIDVGLIHNNTSLKKTKQGLVRDSESIGLKAKSTFKKHPLKTTTSAVVPVTNITLKSFSSSRKFNNSFNGSNSKEAHMNNDHRVKKIKLFKSNLTINPASTKPMRSTKSPHKKAKPHLTPEKLFEPKQIAKSLTYTSLTAIKPSPSKPKPAMSSAKSNSNIRKQANTPKRSSHLAAEKTSTKLKAKNITIRAIRAKVFLNKVTSPKAQGMKAQVKHKHTSSLNSTSTTLQLGKTKSFTSKVSAKVESQRLCTSKQFYRDKKNAVNTTTTSFRSCHMNISSTLKEANDYYKKGSKELNKTLLNRKSEKSLFSSLTSKKLKSELKILQIIPNTTKITLNRSKTSLNCSFQSKTKKEAVK